MTHDELLSKIELQGAGLQPKDNSYLDALRIVVALHKPIHNPNYPDSQPWCWQCADGRGYADFPCPTIRAIESCL